MDQLKVYIAGKVSPTSVFGTHDWRDGFCTALSDLSGVKLVNLDPTKSHPEFTLDETDARLVFGRDCFMIREADLVIVNLTDDISVGGSQEMLIAKHYGRPLVGIAPWGGKFRQREKEISGNVYQDWIHPFIQVPCDVLVETIEELATWITQQTFPLSSISTLSVLDESIQHYLDQYYEHDQYLKTRGL